MTTRILWLHGFATSPRIWTSLTASFDAYEHHYISYLGCETVELLREQVAQTIYKLLVDEQTEQLHVIGWSMGGMLMLDGLNVLVHRAAWPAVKSKLGAVVMVASTLQFTTANRQQGWPRRVIERMIAAFIADVDTGVRQFQMQLQLPGDHPGRQHDFTSAGLVQALMYLRDADLHHAWQQIRLEGIEPFWLHGGQDEICPVGAVPEGIREDHLCCLATAGHVPFVEQHGVWMRTLTHWLRVNVTNKRCSQREVSYD